ncbi:MAG: DNA polymerase IV, partial [Chthoniobacterales bacterium]
VVHLDADAFFASVEQAADPKLRNRPIAVGGEKRGIVASASYEARKCGVYTPMPMAKARKLCPRLVVVPGDFEKYEHFSRFMFSYAYDFTPLVEISSIDEGYFDLTGNKTRSPREIAEVIRKAIAQSLKISVSEGIASNKLISQIASKLKKPSCFLEIEHGRERDFLSPLENKWLPGVGPGMAKVLNQAGLTHIGQIANVPPEQLSLFAGKGARQLWEFAQGIDERQVITDSPDAKSYGEQETFEQDITDEDFILAKLRSIADRLFAKVRADKKTIRTIEVRVRYNDFDDCRRSESLHEPTDLETECYGLLARLLKKAWERRVSLRLVSVKLSGIYSGIFQSGLDLAGSGVDPAQRRRLSPVIDNLRGKYGGASIMRGHDLFLQKYGEAKELGERPREIVTVRRTIEWAPLNFKSGFSFLDALLKPEDAVKLAAARGCRAIALTDPNLHGAVEFFSASKAAGIKPIIAAELNIEGTRMNAYVKNQTGYVNLCALLSQKEIMSKDVSEKTEGLILRPSGLLPEIRYAGKSESRMFDILQSIRTLTLLEERSPEKRSGPFHFPNSEQLFHFNQDSLKDSLAIADECNFEFELGGLRFPRYHPKDGSSARAFLRKLALDGIHRRYGKNGDIPARVRSQIEEEL